MNAAPAPGANILVVDDTVENLRLLSVMLGAQGYEVRPVTNGRQALQAVERDPPDLILLDINMPGMNGYEVCERLKANQALKDIPVIFLTALGDVADKVRAFDVGGIDYITKPFQLEEVQARVKTQIALRRAQLELQGSYQRLAALERLRDDLVHMVVHDMRAPLTVMLGHLEMLRDGPMKDLPPEAMEDVDAAGRAARRLRGMANDLLDVSRLEESKLPLQKAEHDLALAARDAVANLGALDRSRSIELTASGEVRCSFDLELVRRVLENLISNAIKHTRAGDALYVSIATSAGRARVEVRDQGPGVPPEARQRIFEKFESERPKGGQKYHSVGLGLTFCKLAVEAHGGSIGVLAAEPKGSVFWFELPIA